MNSTLKNDLNFLTKLLPEVNFGFGWSHFGIKKLEKKLEKDEQKILLRKKKTLKEINKISLSLSEEIIRKISNGKSEQKNKLKSIIKKNLEEVS